MATKRPVVISKNLGVMIAKLDNFNDVTKKADKMFRTHVMDIFADVVQRSPVDKGAYRADWEFKNVSATGSISAIKLVNNMPYSGVLEVGSPVGGKPWPVAGKTFKRKGKVTGPKTVEKDGRVWSSQMPEPVAGGAVESANWDKLTKEIANILDGEF